MNKKRTRAEKLSYGVPWFRGASHSLGIYLNLDAYLSEGRPSPAQCVNYLI